MSQGRRRNLADRPGILSCLSAPKLLALLLDSSTTVNLRRLLAVRLVLLGLALPVLAAVAVSLGVDLPVAPLAAVAGVAVLLTLGFWWWLGRPAARIGSGAVITQLALDVGVLTAILYLSGGWTNPLISLYLVPIAVAAATLSATATWICAAVCVLAYSLLTRFYLPVFHLHGGDAGFALHVTGMWLTFVAAAMLVAYLGTSMAATLRARDQALAAEREQNLRNEQILGVATLAAGTAHELSTPLASIAVIASELEREASGPARADLKLLLQQVDVCRGALGRLREAAEPRPEPVTAERFLAELCDHFALLRPTVRLGVHLSRDAAAPVLDADQTLRQALLNLLDNAANASPDEVELRAVWSDDTVTVDVLDRGPGLKPGPRANGMGMGLLLANASIERAGGRVHATPRAGGGTCVRVTLPGRRPAAGR